MYLAKKNRNIYIILFIFLFFSTKNRQNNMVSKENMYISTYSMYDSHKHLMKVQTLKEKLCIGCNLFCLGFYVANSIPYDFVVYYCS